MPRCNYPTNPWLLNYIIHQKKGRSATTLHVLKCLDGPFPDGSKMMQVGDGELLMKAQFSADSFQNLEGSDDEEVWERSLIMLKDWEIHLLLKESKEKSEYIINIKRFVVWYDEKGLSTKNPMISCESHPQIKENIANIWTENHLSKQLVADPDDSDKTDTTLNSVPLSILLEQIEKGDQPSSEEQSFDLIPNAGPLLTVSVENLKWNFETENLQDFIIDPKDSEILEAIVEWKAGYQESENPPEKSNIENTVSVLADTSTLKAQCKSSKISPKSKGGPPLTTERCEYQEEEILAPRSNREAEEEEIRLLNLSRISTEHEKCCSPVKEIDKSLKNDATNLKSSSTLDTNEAIFVSGASNASQLNKDSTETSFEIPMSGKVASNQNVSISNSEDGIHCSLLDSVLDSSSEKRLNQWNNLDLSSIESEKQFELATCANEDQKKVTWTSKKLKLTQTSESTCDPESIVSQDSHLNQHDPKLNKKQPISKSPTLDVSKSNNFELNKSISQEDPPINKVSSVNSHKQISDFVCQVKTSLAPTKTTNLVTNTNNFFDSLCEEFQPVEIYATCQELFPKHSACLSLLSSPNQLTEKNNLNNICLNQETMESINTYWSLSHNLL